MLNRHNTLFVFEGERTEGKLFASLERNFMKAKLAITLVFGADIYQLYEQLMEDEYLDVVSLLKKRHTYKGEIDEFDHDSFEGIYLFFDYDGHAPTANDDKIRCLLQYFNNETEQGKLFISYPMVEALRHYKDFESFKNLAVDCSQLCVEGKTVGYKNYIQYDCLPALTNINQYSSHVWSELIYAHLCKMNYLIHNDYNFPQHSEEPITVFEKQLDKQHVTGSKAVAVLSAIPPFVLDYLGVEETKRRIDHE